VSGPVAPFQDWLIRNGAILAGLAIGTAAKYGLTLTEGRKLSWRGLIADMLLLGMLGLLAVIIADACNLAGNARVLAGALSAVSSDRLIRLARDQFIKKIETDIGASANASKATAVMVPAGVGEPDAVTMQPGTADHGTARAGTSLKHAHRGPTRQRPPEDQIELLRRLDAPETPDT
jgi:hypothetical protein